MEHGFFHPDRGYWQTNSKPSEAVLDGYPEGTVEVPLRPSGEHDWNGSKWVHNPPSDAEILARWRETASLPRSAFILAALDAEVLTEAEAEQAVNGWPASWDAFFDGKPARDRIEAKARWVETSVVRRNAPLIAQLAAFKGLTDQKVDALFEAP